MNYYLLLGTSYYTACGEYALISLRPEYIGSYSDELHWEKNLLARKVRLVSVTLRIPLMLLLLLVLKSTNESKSP